MVVTLLIEKTSPVLPLRHGLYQTLSRHTVLQQPGSACPPFHFLDVILDKKEARGDVLLVGALKTFSARLLK
jgi:hypothetical protein